MLTALDHIIIGVRDLPSAVQTFEDRLGLTPSGGGIHPMGGTANRIIVIGDTYLELITIHKPEEAQESLKRRLVQAEGYLNFVLASDSIEADCQAIEERGTAVTGPIPGLLQTQDGRARGWMRADIERPDMVQRYPFLIQHDSTGEERRYRLAGWSAPPEHPLGAIGVYSVTLAVADLAEASHRFASIYGLQPSKPFTIASPVWDAQLVSFVLGNSRQKIEMAAPLALAENNELGRYLAQFGESLFCITLLVKDLSRASRYLDERNIAYTVSEATQPLLLWINAEQSNGAILVLRQAELSLDEQA